MFLFVVVSFT